MFKPLVSLVSLASLVCFTAPLAAQPAADAIGVRAQGMGGAFTAVADDATASWWNPAGMAGGAYFNAILEWNTHREPPDDRTAEGDPLSAWRADTRSLSAAFPALGLSYYRLQFSEIQPQTSTGTAPGSRQEGGAAEVLVRTMVLNQFGASVGQSLGSHLVVGSTVKLVNGGAVTLVQPARTGTLDAAIGLDPSGETRLGLDVGAMGVLGPIRLGVMVRNVTEPQFGTGVGSFTLNRQARVGAAFTTGARGVVGQATLAVDGDLTTTTSVLGDERRIAAGGELWLSSRVIGIRGGVSVNTIGSNRTALSGGASVALKRGLYADGELSGGTDEGRRGWGVGLRVTF